MKCESGSIAAINQVKALVVAFSVIEKTLWTFVSSSSAQWKETEKQRIVPRIQNQQSPATGLQLKQKQSRLAS